MSKSSAHADAVTMSGGGLYSLATVGAKHVIDAAGERVQRAIAEQPVESLGEGQFYTFCDMGCADGGTALEMLRGALQTLRRRAPQLPLQVVHADQPGNDFNALTAVVHGRTAFRSYLDRIDGVFPLFSATSFYRQIVPAGTLDFGFSATAMHWLSQKPCDINGHVHAVGAAGDERERFAAQARRDWEGILAHRAAELKPGGRLVLVNFCIDEQGRYLGNTGGVNMFDTFNALWRELVAAGTVSEAEYAAMTLPQYYNTVAEFSAPFAAEGSATAAGLVLEDIETQVVRCPFAQDFARHQDPAKFAAAYIPTIRSWNESTYFAGLSTRRPEAERRQIVEDYYAAYRRRVAEAPAGHGMDYVHAYMTIRKT